MRTSKSILAGLAAGALTLGLIPFATIVAAPAANAANVTGSVSPVRVTETAGVRDVVPFATLSWTTSAALNANETVDVTLVTAPTSTAAVWIGTQAAATAGADATDADNAVLGTPKTNFAAAITAASGGTATMGIAASQPGTYSGTTAVYEAGVVVDTVSWSFTTRGKATAISVTPAAQTVTVGAPATLTVNVLDAAGTATQTTSVDSVAITTTTGTLSGAALTGGNLATGTGSVTLTQAAAGTATVTVTPQGTLPGAGASTQTVTVTASGEVNAVALTNMTVSAPATQGAAGAQPNTTVNIPAGSSSVTVAVTGTVGTQAGKVVRLEGVASAGTPSAAAPQYVNVTLDSQAKGSATFTLAGAALLDAATLTVKQVTSADVAVAGVQLVATQVTPVTTTGRIVPTPAGNIVVKLGESTAVSVAVTDQFGQGLAGYSVRAFRGSVTDANFLSLGTTNASGVAAVTVSPASTVVNNGTETYVFNATSPAGTVFSPATTTIVATYTTTGGISSMTVTPSGTGSTAFSNTAATLTNAPLIFTPDTAGLVNAANGAASTGSFVVATGAQNGANVATRGYASFQVTTVPGNAATVTVPEGVYVSNEAPDGSTLFSDGARSAQISSGGTAYVWATKTGVHSVTVTSGGISLEGKIKAVNQAADAYNVALSPSTQELNPNAFGAVTVSVTDMFGNPVTTSATERVTLSVTGNAILLAGQVTSITTIETDATGSASISLIAGGAEATSTLSLVPTTGNTAPAWATNYTAPAGVAAPVKSAAAVVEVATGPVPPADKSITIVGERGDVRGKSGIIIEGFVEGIEDGKTVTPFIRFPGQTTFTAGSARPTISGGEFTWQRKTGKRVTVYVEHEDVKSNRVTIQAR